MTEQMTNRRMAQTRQRERNVSRSHLTAPPKATAREFGPGTAINSQANRINWKIGAH